MFQKGALRRPVILCVFLQLVAFNSKHVQCVSRKFSTYNDWALWIPGIRVECALLYIFSSRHGYDEMRANCQPIRLTVQGVSIVFGIFLLYMHVLFLEHVWQRSTLAVTF